MYFSSLFHSGYFDLIKFPVNEISLQLYNLLNPSLSFQCSVKFLPSYFNPFGILSDIFFFLYLLWLCLYVMLFLLVFTNMALFSSMPDVFDEWGTWYRKKLRANWMLWMILSFSREQWCLLRWGTAVVSANINPVNTWGDLSWLFVFAYGIPDQPSLNVYLLCLSNYFLLVALNTFFLLVFHGSLETYGQFLSLSICFRFSRNI